MSETWLADILGVPFVREGLRSLLSAISGAGVVALLGWRWRRRKDRQALSALLLIEMAFLNQRLETLAKGYSEMILADRTPIPVHAYRASIGRIADLLPLDAASTVAEFYHWVQEVESANAAILNAENLRDVASGSEASGHGVMIELLWVLAGHQAKEAVDAYQRAAPLLLRIARQGTDEQIQRILTKLRKVAAGRQP